MNLKRKRLGTSSVAPRFKKFDDIELSDIGISWSIVAKVVVKFPINTHREIQHFILMDITGSKIEAIVRGSDTNAFNMLLAQGCSYTIHEVRFQTKNNLEFRNMENSYECYFDHVTRVEPYAMPIQFPSYPKNLTSFSKAKQSPRKVFVDIAGIVVHWGELEHIGAFPARTLYREIIIMDSRCELLVVGIWSKLLARHAISLPSAAANNHIIVGTMLTYNPKHRCLETSDHTIFGFNPSHRAASELQSMQRSLINKSVDLSFVKTFIEKRWAYLATVI